MHVFIVSQRIQRGTTRTTTNATALMTAREFWTQELPGPMSMLLDPERAMMEETEAAKRTAKKMDVGVTGEAFPWFLWDAL